MRQLNFKKGIETSNLELIPNEKSLLKVVKKVENAKRLEYRPYKGLQIVCKCCTKAIHKSMNSYKGCSHPIDRQIYKAVIIDPYSGNRKTRDLKSKDFDGAIIELLAFKRELECPIITKEDRKSVV